MAFPYEKVIWEAGQDNMGGLSTRAYFIPANAIKTMPAFASVDDTVRKGAFELESGASAVEIYLTYKSGGVKSEPVGDIDGRCSKKSGEFFHPGNTAAMAKFARAVQNTPGVFIFKDTEGRFIVVGDNVNPATVTAAHDTGKGPEERRGWTITFEAYGTRPVEFFEGDIPVAQ